MHILVIMDGGNLSVISPIHQAYPVWNGALTKETNNRTVRYIHRKTENENRRTTRS